MKSVKNIVISGTNFWNPGDDFVRDGVIRILKTIFPDTQLNFLFYNFNQDFFPQNKFSGIHNMVSAGDLNQYKDFVDAVVIAGLSAGTEIKDLYNWVIENNLTDRVYLIGAGYENDYVDHFIKEEPELTIFKNTKVITSRTYKRPQLIDDLTLPFKYINCPAILSVEKVKEVLPDKKIEKIAFSIQLPHGTGVPNHSCNASMYEMSIVLLSELFGKYDIELIAHHKSEYFHFLNLFKQFNVPVKIIFSSFYQDLFNIYPQYDLVITTRLHASLFANGFGIPGIIINDTDRHTHCLQGFKHSHWVNTKEKFYEALDKIKENNLSEIANELSEFKNKLLAKYIESLCRPFGISIGKLTGKSESLPQSHANKLPVHFFTIVLNGKPFIEYHINVFKKLPFEWHWHIVEGVAELKHDTAWSLEYGGNINETLHSNGLSIDGTSEYLNELVKKYPRNITVYRKEDGGFWDGKLEMVNAPLKNITNDCLLWQVDSDELWTQHQFIETRNMFIADKDKTAAFFYCRYFVGEKLFITTKNTYGNHTEYEWLRVWRYQHGDKWHSHEPPALSREILPDIWIDLGKLDPILHEETKAKNLVFQHYAYATEEQLKFKETYYGYAGALQKWKELNAQESYPVCLKDYFDWVKDGSVVEYISGQDFNFLAKNENNNWHFNYGAGKIAALELKCDEDYNRDAEAAINNSELAKARMLLACALNISKDNNVAKNNLAVVEILENKYENAMETLTDILKSDPANQVAHGNKQALEDILVKNNIVLSRYHSSAEKVKSDKVKNSYLFQINFDLNDGCNLDCIMCGNVPNKKYKNQSVMDETLFSRRFVKVFNYATVFQFGCFFEPLMVPYFEKAVWAIKSELKPDVKGTIISNGMLLTQSKIESLVDSDIFSKIRFSIDSVSEELFEKIRSGAKLTKLLDHIEKLVAYRNLKNSKSLVEVNFTIMRENMHELPQLVLLAKRYGIDSITTHKLTPDDVAYVDNDYYKKLTDNVIKAAELAKENGIMFSGQTYYTRETYNATINKEIERVCGYYKRNYFLLTIDCHGNIIHPCKLTDNKLGSLTNKSFEEMLDDMPFNNLKESVQNPKPEICTSCGMFV